jgi:cilia- and flagella-associated protein 251
MLPSQVVGLVKLGLDGNPEKSMGLIAHPREVTALVPTHDGRFVVTAGGSDMTVNLWQVCVCVQGRAGVIQL